MKEGSALLVALLLTAGLAYWSEEHRSPRLASVASLPGTPEPALTPPMPELPSAARQPVVPGPDQAYRCIAGSRQTFSDLPCAPGERQEIFDLRTPASGTPTASYAEQYRRLVASRSPGPSSEALRQEASSPDTEAGKEAECRALMHLIEQIDADLRRPQVPAYIEMQKARRLSASGKRFSLGC